MNKAKLERRTVRAQKIRDHHNPPYRVFDVNRDQFTGAATRADARNAKRDIVQSGGLAWIEQRSDAQVLDGEPVSYSRTR